MSTLTTQRTPQDYREEAAWVLRVGTWGVRALVVVALLALVFTMVNVQVFAAAGHPVSSFEWWIAWLLDPMASITMGTAIVFEGLLAGYGRREGWLAATKWYAGGCTWLMNIWASVAVLSGSGVLLHSVAPGLVLLLAEAAPRVRRQLAEIVANLERQAGELAARQVADTERARREQLAERQVHQASAPGAHQVSPGLASLAPHQVFASQTPGDQQKPARQVPPAGPPPGEPTRSRQVSPAPRSPGSPGGGRQVRQVPTPAGGRQVRQAGDLVNLVRRARPVLARTPGIGRARLAKELGCTEYQARQVRAEIESEPALHAAG